MSDAAESFPAFREPLPEIRIIQILFKLYFEDLNKTKIYILQVSVLTKLSLICFILFLSAYSYHCYNIELTFWLFFLTSSFCSSPARCSRTHLAVARKRVHLCTRAVRSPMFHSTQQSPKMKVAMPFWSALKVPHYAKEKWQERDRWQHEQVNSSNNIIKAGGNLWEVSYIWLNIKSKGVGR